MSTNYYAKQVQVLTEIDKLEQRIVEELISFSKKNI